MSWIIRAARGLDGIRKFCGPTIRDIPAGFIAVQFATDSMERPSTMVVLMPSVHVRSKLGHTSDRHRKNNGKAVNRTGIAGERVM